MVREAESLLVIARGPTVEDLLVTLVDMRDDGYAVPPEIVVAVVLLGLKKLAGRSVDAAPEEMAVRLAPALAELIYAGRYAAAAAGWKRGLWDALSDEDSRPGTPTMDRALRAVRGGVAALEPWERALW